MPYNRQVPDAPIALSMLPRATTLTLDDLLYLVQPGNSIGERSKSLTLAVLAAFLGNKHFSSIMLEGTGGKELTLSGDGVTYVIPPGSGETDQFEFEVSDDKNVTIKMSGPDGVRVVTLTPTSVEVKNTQAGLEHKTTIGNTGITVLSQSRDGANIVETTSEFTYGSLKSQLLKIKDGDQGDYDWDIKVDLTQNAPTWGGVIFGPHNNPLGASVALHIPGLHVWKQATFEKDVSILADVTITKTLTLTLGATFNADATIKGTAHLATIQQEMDPTKSTSVIKVSQTPNPQLASNAATGLRVMVINDTSSQVNVYVPSSTDPQLVGFVAAGKASEFIKTGSLGSDWMQIT